MTNDTASPGMRLHALFDATWARDMAADPLLATYYGETAYNALWPDLSAAARERRHAADRAALAELQGIAPEDLSAADQLNRRLFERELQGRIALHRFRPEAYAITAREGPQSLNELVELMPMDSRADIETWLQRLRGLPAYLAQYTDLLRECAAQGHTQPRMLMERVLPQLDMQIVDDPAQSPFYSAFAGLADQDLQQQAHALIAAALVPAYRAFREFFANDYLPACRDSLGISDTPDGLAFYANRIAHHTSTDFSADDIHQLGLAEVARITAAMQELLDELGFEGSKHEFFDWLRSDPRFYYADAEQLFAAYVMTSKQIEPELPKLFGKLPRTPYGVRPIPATSAPNTTAAYYSGPSADGRRAGYYYVNLYRPEMRPRYEIEVLTTHEAVPGHHLQIALAQEQGELPKFRRFAGYNGYIEGWALYAEQLGYELGLYQDPYSRFGQLSYDIWRALRLVLDTGLHTQGWSREQAISYFRDHAPKTQVDIANEVDRYIGWPGQALSYKIGQLQMLALRARAEAALGEAFDLRAYHDMILDGGALPLDMLADKVQAWIAQH
ncbi:DUF885 domain-containing protein [Paucibacter sp. APW11]|uniref:DUF885 domain-containing protein n=1 Tax=Roseateles aquae TaxID=3077235 RepID=A0ABU3PFN3_9BURK|nr:DUF885 domain-containing protein [Paucibacter sp. APW11]MDT9000982.1 DUF885 domain-containing protein [Paucibacter sp. APW11]